ncbi:MAG: four helix bundle protein [Candidatus Binatia bacterium]
MSESGLENFGAYQKARQLFNWVVPDMEKLKSNSLCYRLVSQPIGSADSICANIEEGYGRLSRIEYARFLDFARGSARETGGRYKRMKHWLAQSVIQQRVDLLDEIIGIQDSAKLRRLIVDLIDKEQWTSLSAVVKGDADEGLLWQRRPAAEFA